MKVSIIIPVYNEYKTIGKIIAAVERTQFGVDKELIIVDDCSTDGTRAVLRQYETLHKVIYHGRNLGKGAALKTGFASATGDYIINQDADLEYDPADHALLVEPILKSQAEVVFGSRLLDPAKNAYIYRRYLWGGIVLNHIVNIVAGTRVNDIFSGSKLFPRAALAKFSLDSNGFEIETELTIKLARAGYNILEVPISYKARTIAEGKKIRPHHAFKILKTAFKSRL